MLNNTELALLKFKKFVAQQSRSRLTKLKKNDTKGLYKRLDGVLTVNPNRMTLKWDLGYGTFQDLGVKGADPSKVSPNAKIKGQQAPNSQYKFGSGRYRGTWGSFVQSLADWAKKKNIRLRDKKGKFKKGNYKTIANIIAGNIYNRGIKPSLFFTKPFEKYFKRLPDELVQKYGLDLENSMENLLQTITKESFNK